MICITLFFGMLVVLVACSPERGDFSEVVGFRQVIHQFIHVCVPPLDLAGQQMELLKQRVDHLLRSLASSIWSTGSTKVCGAFPDTLEPKPRGRPRTVLIQGN